jgi:hypothetical protein
LLSSCVLAYGPSHSRGNRVRAPHCLVNGGGITRGTQRRRQPIVHRLGTICGELPNPGSSSGESPLSNGEAHRWKAPRVQQNASLFAERRGKRPWRRWVVAKAASFPDGLASSSGRPGEHRELQTGPAGRPLTAGVWWASLTRLRASRSARWARHGHTQARVCPAGSASPAGIAASFTTAGVRADRVGAKLPWRAIATEGAGKGESPPGP